MGEKKTARKEPLQEIDEALRSLDTSCKSAKAIESKLDKMKPTLNEMKYQVPQTLNRAQELGWLDKEVIQSGEALQSYGEKLQSLGDLLKEYKGVRDDALVARKRALTAWRTLDESLRDKWPDCQRKKLLDKTLDSLIERMGQFLEEPQKSRLDKAYQQGDYWNARAILYGFYKDFSSKRKKGETDMSTVTIASGNPPLFLILAVLALAILALSFVCMKKLDKGSAPNMKVEDTMRWNGAQKAATERKRMATDKERDFLELIRLLAAASDKTDEYLKS